MTFLIHGATGAQGAPVVSALLRDGESVLAAVRNPSSYTGGGTAVAVDFSSVDSLAEAYQGVDGVFVHLPQATPDQQRAFGEAVAAAVERAQPARVVVSTSGRPFDPAGDDAIAVLARGLESAGASFAVIEPRLYLENLLLPPVNDPDRIDDALVYPLHEDYRASWSSHLDVAEVAVRLFAEPDVQGVVTVGALPGLSGTELAEGFSRYLGREVRFVAQDPDDFGAVLEPLFGPVGAAAVVASYHWRATETADLITAETSAQQRLGLAPRSVEEWLSDSRS